MREAISAILQSASKIVFIMLALTVCLAFVYGIAQGKTILESKDFIMLVAMAFTYYFAKKGDSSK